MNLNPTGFQTQRRRTSVSVQVALVVALLIAQAIQGFGAAPAIPGVATNYVLVTNVVIVTNYVLTTNTTIATGLTNTTLPDLGWVPPADRFDWIQVTGRE